MVEITITGIVREALEKAGGLNRNEIALLTGLTKEKVDSAIKRLRGTGIISGELVKLNDNQKPKGPLPYTWSIKK